MSTQMTTTVMVSGAIANKYLNGGEAWVRLSWALGLRRLGFRVYFVEEIDRGTCLDSTGKTAAFAGCENLAYFKQVPERFGGPDLRRWGAGVRLQLCRAARDS